MATLTALIQHTRGLSAVTRDLIQHLESLQDEDVVDAGVLDEEDVTDLWEFNLLLANGKSLEDIQAQHNELFQRIQARYTTQAEQMEARLASLPLGSGGMG